MTYITPPITEGGVRAVCASIAADDLVTIKRAALRGRAGGDTRNMRKDDGGMRRGGCCVYGVSTAHFLSVSQMWRHSGALSGLVGLLGMDSEEKCDQTKKRGQ